MKIFCTINGLSFKNPSKTVGTLQTVKLHCRALKIKNLHTDLNQWRTQGDERGEIPLHPERKKRKEKREKKEGKGEKKKEKRRRKERKREKEREKRKKKENKVAENR